MDRHFKMENSFVHTVLRGHQQIYNWKIVYFFLCSLQVLVRNLHSILIGHRLVVVAVLAGPCDPVLLVLDRAFYRLVTRTPGCGRFHHLQGTSAD